MTKKQRARVDMIVLAVILAGFALYYIPTHDGGMVGWERVIPLGFFGLYWVCRETIFRWLDRRR